MTEQKKIFIKPALGADGKPLQVRKHDKPMEFLMEIGEWVVKHTHWLRRLKDGSVVEATPPAESTAATKPAPAATETPAALADSSPAAADSKTAKATKATAKE